MQGYAKRERLPDGLPGMDTLKPVAERCLAMAEPNVKLCLAVGSPRGRQRDGRYSVAPTVLKRLRKLALNSGYENCNSGTKNE
jgi:hypothetical protein